ncbi:MAG: hypothetical protein H0X30_00585 [Anaerolineae bacterium]|nr:hypothetical protein [Anaerolineae bacterium]
MSFRESKRPAPLKPKVKSPRPHEHATDSVTPLQQTLGNAATQRSLNTDPANPADLQNRIATLQPMIGNSGVQRMMKSQPSSVVIQRQLRMTSANLSGKKEQTTFGKVFDNASSSTFRAIEEALDHYHKTGVDDGLVQEKFLSVIINRTKEWLDDKSHKKASDQQKRDSLNILLGEARTEYHRVIITKELGVPRLTADGLNPNDVEQFWQVVLAFDQNDAKTALFIFGKIKSKLGDGASLIESFMKRNQVSKIDPELSGVMNNPKFEMKSHAGNANAINLVKAQAQQKLARLTKLQGDAKKLDAFYRADREDMIAKKQPQPTYADLPADKKALYVQLEDKQYVPDALKILKYPLLQPGLPEALELSKLTREAEHYQALISDKAIKDKKGEKGFDKFTDTELFGVMGYTSNLYGAINSPLRFDVGDNTKFTAGHAALAGSITSALNKIKPFKGDVYRHGGDFKGYSSVNVAGAVVSDMAPLSTAIDQKGPASAAEQHEVLEILTSVAGRDVSKMSMFGGKEGEVLFAPGTRFRVVAAFERNQAMWGQEHKPEQWAIRGQRDMAYFAQAMAAVEKDDRKKEFHRVVIKVEVG